MKIKLTILLLGITFFPLYSYASNNVEPAIVGTDIVWTVTGVALSPNYGYSGCSAHVSDGCEVFGPDFQSNLPGPSGTVTRALNGNGIYILSIANTGACTGSDVFYDYNATGCSVARTEAYVSGGVITQISYNSRVDISEGTRIISHTPENDQTVSTTTTLTVLGFVNSGNWNETTEVEVRYTNPNCSATSVSALDAITNVVGQGCGFTITNQIESSGGFEFSTSTTFVYGGRWNFVATIKNTEGAYCLFGYCLTENQNQLAQRTGTFVIGQIGAVDLILDYIASSTYLIESGFASTSQAVSNMCNPFNVLTFDISTCLGLLFLPTASDFGAFYESVAGNFLRVAPWGYATRAITIINSSTTVQLPSLIIPTPGGDFNLTPWGYLLGTSSILTTASSTFTIGGTTYGTGQTLREVTEGYWNFAWYLILALAITHDLIGVGRPGGTKMFGKGAKRSGITNDEYAYKEKLYQLSQRR